MSIPKIRVFSTVFNAVEDQSNKQQMKFENTSPNSTNNQYFDDIKHTLRCESEDDSIINSTFMKQLEDFGMFAGVAAVQTVLMDENNTINSSNIDALSELQVETLTKNSIMLFPVAIILKQALHWQKQRHENREWDMTAHKNVIMEIMSQQQPSRTLLWSVCAKNEIFNRIKSRSYINMKSGSRFKQTPNDVDTGYGNPKALGNGREIW
ncbi:hypothetical protein CBL_00573 [Carabus blaptoides fortunei]